MQDEAGLTAMHLATFRDDSVLEMLLLNICDLGHREASVNITEGVFGLAPLAIAAGLASERSNAIMKR